MTATPYIPSGGLTGKLVRMNARLRARKPMKFELGKPLVSITFDDFPRSAALTGRRMVEERGWRGTWYASCDFIDSTTHHGAMMSAEDLTSLDAAGHEIACHTLSHTDAARVALPELLTQIDQNADAARAAGLTRAFTNFAYPFGEASPQAKTALMSRFDTLRGVRPGVNRTGDDLALLKAVGLDGGDTGITKALGWIEDAVASPGWLILYAHDIQDHPTEWGCTPQEFKQVLDAVAASGAAVLTVRDAVARLSA